MSDFVTPGRQYHAIIFDLAGVLVRWKPHLLLREAACMCDEPLPPVERLVRTDEWLAFDHGVITQQELVPALARRAGISESLVRRFLAAFPPHLRPIGAGVTLLRAVKKQGLRAYALSNMPQPALTYMLKHYEFFSLFDGMIISCQVGLGKPEPAIYERLLATYALQAKSCLFIDDTPINLVVAHSLGIDGLWCNDHRRLTDVITRLLGLAS